LGHVSVCVYKCDILINVFQCDIATHTHTAMVGKYLTLTAGFRVPLGQGVSPA
jgi:hypothetical protein